METFKDTRLLTKVTKYGGFIEEYGNAYLDIIDNQIIIIRCAKESINHINTFEREFKIIEIDMENKIPKIYYDKILFHFRNSFNSWFGPKFAENFANYENYKKNAQEMLLDIKNHINGFG